MRNGPSGRYYKTKEQVDARVAQILLGAIASLVTVTTGTEAGRSTIAFCRNSEAIAAPARQSSLHAEASRLLSHAVADARGEGCSWAQIGDLLGVTRASTQQRYGRAAPDEG